MSAAQHPGPLTPEEFEALQLQAHMVFCRQCGLRDDRAVPMRHMGVQRVTLPPEARDLPMHLYCCPVCNHHAASQQHEHEAARVRAWSSGASVS